jgi:hypothetical protein
MLRSNFWERHESGWVHLRKTAIDGIQETGRFVVTQAAQWF